jgi:hypothetical protein
MSLTPRHRPGPSGTADPLSIFGQTADVLFAWAYIAPFTLCLPYLLNPPFWVSALSMGRAAEPPRESAAPLSPVPLRRAT